MYCRLGAPEAKEKALFIRLFPYSLIGKFKEWYLDQLAQVMNNWNIMEETLLGRFFPHNNIIEVKTIIGMFSQGATKTLYESGRDKNP